MLKYTEFKSSFYGDSMFNKDKECLEWINYISKSYKNCQIKVSLKVNSEMFKIYYVLGEETSKLAKKEHLCGWVD